MGLALAIRQSTRASLQVQSIKQGKAEMATSNYLLPPPQPLEIHDPQAAEKWKKFKRAWTSYALATELKGNEAVQ